MSDQLVNALLAVVAGSLVAVVLVVPVAAVMYRREGALGFRSLLTLLAAAVYGVALWTYTLLPVPERDEIVCAGTQRVLFASIDDVLARGVSSPGELLGNAAFMQLALNVALFVPFGFFVRRVLRRGFVVAGVLGFATSLLVEFTQLTGVWGIYPCAYRVFDVDDLLTNTTGAVLGSLLSALFVSTQVRRRPLPRRVSRGRRWMGMVCDLLAMTVVAFAVNVAWRWFHLYGAGAEKYLDGALEDWVAWGAAGLLQLAVVLVAGRTIGEWAIAVRTVARRPALALPGRLVKWAAGVGAYAALSAWSGPGWVQNVFLVVTVLAVWSGENHRGLANFLGGLDLTVQVPDDEHLASVRGQDDRSEA